MTDPNSRDSAPSHDLQTVIRTLLIDGFHLDSFRRSHRHLTLNVHRYDRFGISIPYAVALFEDAAQTTALSGFLSAAQYERRHPLVVAPAAPEGVYSVTVTRFLSLLGGAVDDSLIRHPDLARILDALGRHALPATLQGDPEELLEDAVASCLQFLLGQRARKWGIDRRFERLPDGVLPGAPVLLYDANLIERVRQRVRSVQSDPRSSHSWQAYVSQVVERLAEPPP